MATPSVTFTFAPNTLIKSSEANTNFQNIISFLTNETIHKDASVAFTGVPSGPATDPTTDNQFTRKAFVDAATLRRPRTAPSTYPGRSGSVNAATTQLVIQAGTLTGVTSLGGDITLTFPTAFVGGLVACLPVNGDSLIGPFWPTVLTNTLSTVTFRCFDHAGGVVASTNLRIDWIAIGW